MPEPVDQRTMRIGLAGSAELESQRRQNSNRSALARFCRGARPLVHAASGRVVQTGCLCVERDIRAAARSRRFRDAAAKIQGFLHEG